MARVNTYNNFEYESSLLFPTNMWQSKLNVTDTPHNVITITSPSFDINQTFPLILNFCVYQIRSYLHFASFTSCKFRFP